MKIRLSRIFEDFFESEKTSGLVLIVCTVLSILIANSSLGGLYLQFWHHYLDLSFPGIDLNYSMEHWVNDGLMAIFFLLVGLEIERELYHGELSDFRNALLPIVAAIGGMIIPALFHLLFNAGTVSQGGMGIPIATDIAFALGVLSLLGNRVPPSLKIFLTALAIIDDLGAVIVIALFYTKGLSLLNLGGSVMVFILLLILKRLKVNRLIFYLLPGVLMWYFMLKSGVHATVAGIMLALAVPFRKDESISPSFKLQHWLHRPVSFFILPVFALANTGIVLTQGWHLTFAERNTAGILTGLVLGKPLGICFCSLIAIKMGLCRLPDGVTMRHITGAGALAGIGFTMSIFIANLAFTDGELIRNSKIAILSASAIAAVAGFLFLLKTGKSPHPLRGARRADGEAVQR